MPHQLRAGWIAVVCLGLLAGASEARAAGAPPVLADDADAAAPVRPRAETVYGVAARGRWVSVPGWLLDGFTKQNVPLSRYAVAGELFLRRRSFEFSVAVGYQNLSPPDGNWLGKLNSAATDTDYVQFRGLAVWTVDASFIWHTPITSWLALRYGAGIGVGIMRGKILRTSNYGCTDANAGDPRLCHPQGVDPSSPVPVDRQIAALGPGTDDPTSPHRFEDSNVPPAIPIVNILFGLQFRVPKVRGWEARLEAGFYDLFFLGGGVAYTF